MRLFLLTLSLLFSINAHSACVVLLHGLARSSDSMNVLEERLSNEGFFPVNQAYPSREHDIKTLAELAIPAALAKCPKETPLHFVTHSLGGILVRQYLSEHNIENLGRVVMLGPPNQGSEVVDKLGDIPGFHFMNGDAGMQLGTGKLSIPNSLGKANFDLGVVAGSKSINVILSALIPSTDDGKVSIESTKLEGMKDHIVMPVSHPFIMKNKQVITQVIHYLKHGRFAHEDNP